MTQLRVLVYGFGNPGRTDDGLGPAAAAALERRALPGVTVDANYQLSVEDAAIVAEHDAVVFIDADGKTDRQYYMRPVEPVNQVSFSSHSVSPEAVMGLAHELFAAHTAGWLVGIRAYSFDPFNEALTDAAQENMRAAVDFLVEAIGKQHFEEAAGRPLQAGTRDAGDER
jgi:hydrogenase maturation protease